RVASGTRPEGGDPGRWPRRGREPRGRAERRLSVDRRADWADGRAAPSSSGGEMNGSSDRAVVIGSGLGGLAAAVRLRARGYRVTVLEALDQPGGRARVFREGGFTFDAGPTVITAPYLLEELFALAGRTLADYVRLVPIDPFYRILFPNGETFD